MKYLVALTFLLLFTSVVSANCTPKSFVKEGKDYFIPSLGGDLKVNGFLGDCWVKGKLKKGRSDFDVYVNLNQVEAIIPVEKKK